ncbi:MAG: hypothetical protein S4CHLAM2_04550 [Chlamydiales bacterium]|nr:hypothetical protein [Chlamydiales bacterium]
MVSPVSSPSSQPGMPTVNLRQRGRCVFLKADGPLEETVKALIIRLGIYGNEAAFTRVGITVDRQPCELQPSDQQLIQAYFNEGTLPFQGVRATIQQEASPQMSPRQRCWEGIITHCHQRTQSRLLRCSTQLYQLSVHAFRRVNLPQRGFLPRELSFALCAHGKKFVRINRWHCSLYHNISSVSFSFHLLRSYCPKLKTLFMNAANDSFSPKERAAGLPSSLNYLVMSGAEDIVGLNKVIESCTQLKKLGLFHNDNFEHLSLKPLHHLEELELIFIDCAGDTLSHLAQEIPGLTELSTLKILESKLHNLRDLARVLPNLNNLKILNLNWNKISDEGVTLLAQHLPRSLEKLFLRSNTIRNEGALALAAATAGLPALRVVDLQDNYLRLHRHPTLGETLGNHQATFVIGSQHECDDD